jgi:hypothetical protein
MVISACIQTAATLMGIIMAIMGRTAGLLMMKVTKGTLGTMSLLREDPHLASSVIDLLLVLWQEEGILHIPCQLVCDRISESEIFSKPWEAVDLEHRRRIQTVLLSISGEVRRRMGVTLLYLLFRGRSLHLLRSAIRTVRMATVVRACAIQRAKVLYDTSRVMNGATIVMLLLFLRLLALRQLQAVVLQWQ